MTLRRRISPYALGLGSLALLLILACLLVAQRQWFAADDFAYLARARGGFPHIPWTLREVFLPTHPGFNWAYRPLSLETFFFVGHAAFGLQTFGYLVTSLAFHFGSGVLVYLLARRLAFHPGAALFAALVSVALYPTLSSVFWVCIFSYVLSKFLMLAAVLLALAAWRPERTAARLALLLGSTAATGLALLSQELAIVTPAIVAGALLIDGRLGGTKAPWGRLGLIVALQLAVAAIWLYVRLRVIVVAPQSAIYGPFFGPNLIWNPLHQIAFVFGSWPILVAVSALWLGSSAGLLSRPEVRAATGPWLLRVGGLALIWLAAVLAPFSMVGAPLPRFSIPAEVPVALLLGAAASALWAGARGRLRASVPVAALVTVLAVLPYRALWQQAELPRGAQPRALVEFVKNLPRLRPHTSVIVLYGGEQLASAAAAAAFEEETWHSTVLLATHPTLRLRLVLRDVSREPAIQPCDPCVHLQLGRDLTLQPLSPP